MLALLLFLSGPGLLFFVDEYNIKVNVPRDGDVTGVEVQYILDDAVPRYVVDTAGYLSFGPMTQCVVHALKGLACRARGAKAT